MKKPLLKYLIKQERALEKQLKRTYRNPSRKNIHNLRVTIRRIRGALWLAEHASPPLSFGELPLSLRKLCHSLGEHRELDVAIEDAAIYHLKVKKLKSQRKSLNKVILSKIDPKHRKEILGRLRKAVKKISKHPDADLHDGIVKLRSRLNPWIGKPRISGEDFHKLRIDTKKTRYALEVIGCPIQPLKNLQSLLGRGHDLEILQDLSGKNPKIEADAIRQFKKARRVIQPTLRFAVKQLNTKATIDSKA